MKEACSDRFRTILILILAALGIMLMIMGQGKDATKSAAPHDVVYYYQPGCPHCLLQKSFNKYLKAKYPTLAFVERDASLPDNARLLALLFEQKGRDQNKLSVPVTVVGPYAVFGFISEETSGVQIERAIAAYIHNDPSLFKQADIAGLQVTKVKIPIVGEFELKDYSLPALAVIIGLADGFNPCAMWVLVYLISLIMAIKDRRKIWGLVGTFVLASGVLYFLFMTAWLNVFLLLGYVRFLTIIVGLFALGAGILNIREWVVTKGDLACKIEGAESRQKTMGRVARIVNAPLTVVSFFSIIALAFLVNAIEFVCSAALPAVFTHALSLRKLVEWQYYGYILLYDFFFMLDDLIIFSLAALALDTTLGNRYVKHCRIIAGILLVVLGLIMAFKPEWLR